MERNSYSVTYSRSANGKNWRLRWRDEDKKQRQKTVYNCTEPEIRRAAAQKQIELLSRCQVPNADMTWAEFDGFYRRMHLTRTSPDNQWKWQAVFKIWQTIVPPTFRLRDTTSLHVLQLQQKLYDRLATSSVKSYLATWFAGASFAAEYGLMPPMSRPRRRGRVEVQSAVLRTRPITAEDLQRILAAVPGVVGKEHTRGWREYLRGLWLSGCRMREPLEMHWTRRDCHRPLDLDDERPKFVFTASQKNRRDVVSRITRNFAKFLQSLPRERGWIFNPTNTHGRVTAKSVLSRTISEIGVASKVELSTSPVRTPTAKQYRSSFGTRMAGKGVPMAILQNMMRHSDQRTTAKYYVGNLADAAWVED